MPAPLPAQRQFPIATQRHGATWLIVVAVLLPLILGGGIFYVVMKKTAGLRQLGEAASTSNAISSNERMMKYTSPGNTLTYDVNGDSHPDIITKVNYVINQKGVFLAAFDGTNGKKLWQSPHVGSMQETAGQITAIVGNTVLQTDSLGNIAGFSVSNGSQLYKVSLGEKLTSLCGNGDHSIAVNLADKSWKQMSLPDGSFIPLPGPPENCSELQRSYRRRRLNRLFFSGGHAREAASEPSKLNVDVDGMNITETVVIPGEAGTEFFLAVGYKAPGTRIPMLARFHDAALDEAANQVDTEGTPKKKRKTKNNSKRTFAIDWSVALPSVDPLTTTTGAPNWLASSASCIATAYEKQKAPPVLVCFAPTTGERKWEVSVSKRALYMLQAIDIVGDYVYVNVSSQLEAFTVDRGEPAFKIGN